MKYLYALGAACALEAAQGFGVGGAPRVVGGSRRAVGSTRRSTSVVMAAEIFDAQVLLAYSDEAATAAKSVASMSQLIGLGGVATVGLFGVLASALKLPQTAKIELTEDEQDAVMAATLLYDTTPEDQAITESGTVGELVASHTRQVERPPGRRRITPGPRPGRHAIDAGVE